MKIGIATVTDKNYLLRALTLYRSMAPYLAEVDFRFFILDSESNNLLHRLGVPVESRILMSDIEPQELKNASNGRNTLEYCATAKGFVLQHLFETIPEIEWAIWLDSDMSAFSHPGEFFRDVNDASIIITPHTTNEVSIASAIPNVGLYNAGFVGFKNDYAGREALGWWMLKCIEECPQVPTPDAYTDQKYLNFFPGQFDRVYSEQQSRVNVGPWNVNGQTVVSDGGHVHVNGQLLSMYHFQGFKFIGKRFVDFYGGDFPLDHAVIKNIYRPYLRLVESIASEIVKIGYEDILPSPKKGAVPMTFKHWKRLVCCDRGIQAWNRGRNPLLQLFH